MVSVPLGSPSKMLISPWFGTAGHAWSVPLRSASSLGRFLGTEERLDGVNPIKISQFGSDHLGLSQLK